MIKLFTVSLGVVWLVTLTAVAACSSNSPKDLSLTGSTVQGQRGAGGGGG